MDKQQQYKDSQMTRHDKLQNISLSMLMLLC